MKTLQKFGGMDGIGAEFMGVAAQPCRWRTGALTRATGYLGVFLGVAGSLTMILALTEIMSMIFRPGMMVWSVWAGIVMLRRTAAVTATRHSA